MDESADNVHPTPETLDRLQRGGAKGFRYDENGDVMSTIAVATCALNNNVIISHSVGPDRGQRVQRAPVRCPRRSGGRTEVRGEERF